ncbi:helix-turn-helix domain-containing protein [Planotetraspora sp. GP83]|uniref:helix-turn-helix domain-containing protein n=1 Tax=Planotetraspora sp. GP83 TaxID=3156264 RepID=UPI003513821C
MFTVCEWTGREARALRLAKRMSVRAFAEHLGVAVRTVSKWEAQGMGTRPRPDTQAVLDTAPARLAAAEQVRFQRLLADTGNLVPVRDAWSVAWEYESWTDDLERSAILLSRQDYRLATALLSRWLARFPADNLERDIANRSALRPRPSAHQHRIDP